MAKNNIEHDYLKLLYDVFKSGELKEGRNGKIRSVFGRQIRHDMSLGFPLLTTKKMYWKGIVTELLWFLRGDTNIKYLVDNNCHIWDGDCFANYIKNNPNADEQMISDAGQMVNIKEWFINKIKTDNEFAKKWGELGPVYGAGWRNWNGEIDQIANLINELKTNPDSRRLMVSAWNVGELDQMVLPPCHYGFQVYTRELTYNERCDLYIKKYGEFDIHPFQGKDVVMDGFNIPKRAISLMWNQRSVDTFLGLPFNIASYGLLLTILAKEVNMVPDQLIGNLGDIHFYLNHLEPAKEQLRREPFELPTLNPFPIYQGTKPGIECYVVSDFTLKNYKSHETIKAPLSN